MAVGEKEKAIFTSLDWLHEMKDFKHCFTANSLPSQKRRTGKVKTSTVIRKGADPMLTTQMILKRMLL